MNILRLLKKRKEESALYEAAIEFDRLISKSFSCISHEVFNLSNQQLSEAIWGFGHSSGLSNLQKELYNIYNPKINDIISLLKDECISTDTVLMVEYVLRNIAVTKLAYFRDVTLLKRKVGVLEHDVAMQILGEIESIGVA